MTKHWKWNREKVKASANSLFIPCGFGLQWQEAEDTEKNKVPLQLVVSDFSDVFLWEVKEDQIVFHKKTLPKFLKLE